MKKRKNPIDINVRWVSVLDKLKKERARYKSGFNMLSSASIILYGQVETCVSNLNLCAYHKQNK